MSTITLKSYRRNTTKEIEIKNIWWFCGLPPDDLWLPGITVLVTTVDGNSYYPECGLNEFIHTLRITGNAVYRTSNKVFDQPEYGVVRMSPSLLDFT